jgi:hypothetical protein
MAGVSSIFFDSASTFMPSFYALERLVGQLNANKIPAAFLAESDERKMLELSTRIARCDFKLMHLVEKEERAQNSTAWLRIEPCDIVPAIATLLR